MNTIGICMATFNGAEFLQDQLDSISGQTCADWHLWVRDDGSTDATGWLLSVFARRHPGKVTIVSDALGRLGPRENFVRLMELADTPYIAFADQDDVWLDDKLMRARGEMRRLEARHGADHPVMVHADRRLIDRDGREITASYWASRGCDASAFRFETCLAFCLAAGATMLINRALVDRALPVPAAARMYDTWIELVAQAFGTVSALDGIALEYRRHSANVSGTATDIDSPRARRLWARGGRLIGGLGRQRHIYALYFAQAAAFQARFGATLPPHIAHGGAAFLALPERSLIGRMVQLVFTPLGPPGLVRRVVLAMLSGGLRAAT